MKIKKNDIVKILKGKDRGKTGKVLSVLHSDNKMVVEGVNIYKKHARPKKQGQKGEVIGITRPMSASNVLLFCSSCNQGVRFGLVVEGDKKNRICKKCQKKI